MAKLGISDCKDLVLPGGWDGTYITQEALADGATYEEVFVALAAAVASFNADLNQHPWLSILTFQADVEDFNLEYRQGANQAFQPYTEYAAPDIARGEISGHLIPRELWEFALGWTWKSLREARMTRIDADIMQMVEAARNILEVRALRRLFRMEDDAVGAGGTSPGFVTAASGITYAPPEYYGKTFLSTHEHYLRYAARGEAALRMARHLWEHGHQPPYEMLIYDLDASDWGGIQDDTNEVYFRSIKDPEFEYASDLTLVSGAFNRVSYMGALDVKEVGAILLRKVSRVPDEYCAMFKPYGVNDARNSLWWRGGKAPIGHGLMLRLAETLQDKVSIASGLMEFGFGTGQDRTNGVLCKIAEAGAYTTPTIS